MTTINNEWQISIDLLVAETRENIDFTHVFCVSQIDGAIMSSNNLRDNVWSGKEMP